MAGNRFLYELCEKYGIGHRRVGKLIVATADEETGELKALLEQGQKNGVEGLVMLSGREVKELEPNIHGVAAILCPSTGIIDSYALMKYFIAKAKDEGAQIAYKTEVIGIQKVAEGYKVTVRDSSGESAVITRTLINCAGLRSDKVAELAGIDIVREGYRLYYCKGEYFRLRNSKSILVKRLIYPVPPPKLAGVGIHLTLDLEGRVLLGPSIQYIDSIDYTVDNKHKELFYESVKRYLPWIRYDDLEPEMAGIRPKLQEPGGEIRDFLIRVEEDKGLPGLVNLVGIESPGLTASPAIASYVWHLIEGLFSK